MAGRMYSVTEAAEILGLHRNTVAQLCRKYDFPKAGTQYIIDDTALDFLRSRRGMVGRPKGYSPKKKDAEE